MLIGKRQSNDFLTERVAVWILKYYAKIQNWIPNKIVLKKIEIGPDYFVALFWDLFSVCWNLFLEDLSLDTELWNSFQ